ncbi:hypothetical protein SBRCBS47491_001243 [Sporothrix bragantina]|uniref:Uncharacterized protein n=1 Tax=Sporothrix bragantina TaxID=671064 RepID=A0ABP0AX59_9PEZI
MNDADVDMYDVLAGGGDRDGYQSEAGTVVTAVTAASAVSDAPSTSRPHGRGHHKLHRRKSVYDAVAGRVRIREPRPPKWPGQPTKYRNTMLAPEEALFRAANAPDRYEETDTYFAHEDLDKGVLPPTDLVKAVHHYASHYYEALARRQGVLAPRAVSGPPPPTIKLNVEEQEQKQQDRPKQKRRQKPKRLVDERSMDETALLAFGILLEEAGRDVLGADGSLVFTEAVDGAEEEGEGGEDGEQASEAKMDSATAKESGASGKKKAGKKPSSSGQHP